MTAWMGEERKCFAGDLLVGGLFDMGFIGGLPDMFDLLRIDWNSVER